MALLSEPTFKFACDFETLELLRRYFKRNTKLIKNFEKLNTCETKFSNNLHKSKIRERKKKH